MTTPLAESSPPPAAPSSVKSLRLSLSSLSSESPLKPPGHSKLATDVCGDVERELEAIETRLNLYKHRSSRRSNADNQAVDDSVSVSPGSSASSRMDESLTYSKLSKTRKQAGQVADEVANTLLKCDQLLQRVKSNSSSRVSSISNTRERSAKIHNRKMPKSSSRKNSVALSESIASSAAAPSWEVTKQLAIEEEESQLVQKAAAVKRFAAQCQRDVETSTTAVRTHHKQLQASYLKDLQRKYESKKQLTLMTLREKYEKETKALVRAKAEEYELEEAVALKNTRVKLMEERNRVLQDIQHSHQANVEEQLSQLEVQLTTDTERQKLELNNQLQEEFQQQIKKLQDDKSKSLDHWEVEQRQELEQQLMAQREAMVGSLLKSQEEQTAALKKEIQSAHAEKEEAELQKLKKALAFGAQAQLQQLRKRLETEHEEKVNEIQAEASLALEKKTEELRQMLTRSHQEQQEQLQQDLEKKNRVSVMELHDTLQTAHQKELQALRDAAEQRRIDALDSYRKEFEVEARQELQALETALEQEMRVKLQQLEIDQADECELKLEELRARVVRHHAQELEAKKSRMIQCKNVLLAEASAFLSLEHNDNNEGDHRPNQDEGYAATHLLQLKKHLSKELTQYVDVMVADFDELAEEQRILVAKITESTQLYLSYKRQCGALEARSLELANGLETLHDQLEQKDDICKKLYQANEVLLTRLQTPALEASVAAAESEPESPRVDKSPALEKALKNASSWQKKAKR